MTTIGNTRRVRRGIMSVLRPLTGDRASGTVFAAASAGQGSILVPKNCYLLPVPKSATGKGQIARDMPLRTTAATTVLEAGTTLPVTSLLGGTRYNLADTTVLRWDPPLVGLELTCTLQGAMAGGLNASPSPGMVKTVIPFEALAGVEQAKDLFHARIPAHPALVLAWAGSRNAEWIGEETRRRHDLWKLYVVVENQAGALERIDEALDILDAIEGYLGGRTSFDGFVFCSAPGIDVLSRELVRGTASSTIYSMTFQTTTGSRRIETRSIENGDYATWLRNQLDLDTATPSPLAVVDQAIYDHSE